MDDLSNKSETVSENSSTVFEVRSSDDESTLANNRFTKSNEYHVVPPLITGNPLTPRADISFAGLDEYAFRNKIIESKTTETNKTVGTTNEATILKPKSVNETVVSKSKNPVLRDKILGQYWKKGIYKYGIITKGSNVSTARPLASKIAQTNSVIRPNHPRLDIVRPKASNSSIKRSYFTQPVYRPKGLKPDVKTFGIKNMTTVGTRVVVSKGKVENVLKKDKWGPIQDLVTGILQLKSGGSSGKDKGPTQEYILLHYILIKTGIPVKDVCSQEGQHQMPEDEQVWQDELEMMITQEVVANAMNDESRQAFEEDKRRIASQKKAAQATSTNQLSTVRPFVSTALGSSVRYNCSGGRGCDEFLFVYLGGKTPIDASTLPNVDLPINPNMSDLEDVTDTLPNDGIFNGAYDDDEDVGAMADFNNMDNTIAVSLIPTLRIHKDHPKGQILGDPSSVDQTRGKIQRASSAQQALVWILVDLPFGKKEIGTKWVFINKRDERSIVVKNKARLVAQGHRQEEGIDYDEVFAPVAE
ncbi:putative ribonuclease H-like domain-containing protein [Tanacetum coccineum]